MFIVKKNITSNIGQLGNIPLTPIADSLFM